MFFGLVASRCLHRVDLLSLMLTVVDWLLCCCSQAIQAEPRVRELVLCEPGGGCGRHYLVLGRSLLIS